MLTAIVSLSVVVILVTILHLYARFILRRQARRRATLRQLAIIRSVNANSTDDAPRTGLDPLIIASLPAYVYKQAVAGDAIPTECSVCLSFLENEEMVRVLPNCKHNFHSECIDKWLSTHSTCPICRTAAEPKPVAEPPVIPATAPPLEGTSDGGGDQPSEKIRSGPSSRLDSFRRMLSRDRTSPRVQSRGDEDGVYHHHDVERQ
jgi:E3 ubiquitin-protein ligase ATL41